MKGIINKLVELILPLEDKLNSFLSGFSDKPDNYPLYIALIGSIVLTILFIVALLAFRVNKLNLFKRNLKHANVYIESIGIIDEDEVPELYKRIERLPMAIQQGWAKFMDQQVGYPSDYIEDQAVFGDKKVDRIKKSGRYSFAIVGTILIFVTLFAISIVSRGILQALAADLSDTISWTKLIANTFLGLTIPVVFLLIYYLILGFIRKRLTYKVAALFDEFQDLLYRSVTLLREEVPEYVSENIEEINAYIDEILKNKLEDKEIIQLVTTPKVDYADYIQDLELQLEQPEAVPEPVVEKVQEPPAEQPKVALKEEVKEEVKEEAAADVAPVATPVIQIVETERSYLEQLRVLVEMAIKDKVNTTKQDLEDLAVVIATAKEDGYPDPKDQKLLDDCLYMLSDLYYS